jgi:hypothetical protein
MSMARKAGQAVRRKFRECASNRRLVHDIAREIAAAPLAFAALPRKQRGDGDADHSMILITRRV